MAANPPSPSLTLDVHISGEQLAPRLEMQVDTLTRFCLPVAVTCNVPARGLNSSKRHRLTLSVTSPGRANDLRKPKSDYVQFKNNSARWENPFGPSL